VKAEAAPAMPASPKRPRPVFGTVQAQPEPAAKEEGGKAFDLGLAEWRQNNFSAAIGHFEAAVTAEPNNAHAFWNLAVLLDRQGEGKKAIAAMERAEEIYRAHGQREDVLKAREHLLEWYKKYGGQAGAQAAQG
jgi:tetratricopeptide (TPR) repeat protein